MLRNGICIKGVLVYKQVDIQKDKWMKLRGHICTDSDDEKSFVKRDWSRRPCWRKEVGQEDTDCHTMKKD